MVDISQAHAETRLQAWLDAEATLTTVGSYSISTGSSSRTLTKRDLPEIRAQIDYWYRLANRAERGGLKVSRVVTRG